MINLKAKTKKLTLDPFDSSYFRGTNHLEEDGTKNYLVFQPMFRYLKRLVVFIVVVINFFGNRAV